MENNNNNYQVLNKNPQPDINPQQGYGSYVQPYNVGNMHPYNAGQPSITYNVAAQPITEKNLPEEFKPISAWGYIGYNLLFSIPIIGTIMLFVYAFGGTSKINLRNYARSFFCVLIIAIAIFVFFTITGGLASLTSGSRY